MGEVKRKRPGPEFTMIDIPEEHQLRMQILTLPEHDINIALGSDYTGECKKGFLRQAMFRADQRGMLGLHAGTKVVRARDRARASSRTTASSCSASRPPASPRGPATSSASTTPPARAPG